MLTRTLLRIAHNSSKIKINDILNRSYPELVDLVAQKYVIFKICRVIRSLTIPILPLSIRFNINSKSYHPEIGYSILGQDQATVGANWH